LEITGLSTLLKMGQYGFKMLFAGRDDICRIDRFQ
jgi:hypothetical protein